MSLPHLPVETWTEIFCFATAVPDPMLRPHIPFKAHFIENEIKPSSASMRRYEASLKTKLALTKVCHQWNVLGRKLLYEHVVLWSQQGLEALLRTVMETGLHPQRVGGVGSLVNRLDIPIPKLKWSDWPKHGSTKEQRAELEHSAANLCRALPNLVTLVLGLHANEGFRFLPFKEVFPRLEALTPCHSNTLSIDTEDWPASIDALPHLTTFLTPYFSDKRTKGHDTRLNKATLLMAARYKSLPAVEDLVCTDFWIFNSCLLLRLPPHCFPNLQRVTLLRMPELAEFQAFLASHGAALTSIHFHLSRIAPREDLREYLAALQKHCPRISELRVVAGGPDTNVHPVTEAYTVRTVTTLGYQRRTWETYRMPDHTSWEQLFDDIQDAVRYFPNLRRVRIMDEDDLDTIRTDSIFKDFIDMCRARGLDVIDDFDRSLN